LTAVEFVFEVEKLRHSKSQAARPSFSLRRLHKSRRVVIVRVKRAAVCLIFGNALGARNARSTRNCWPRKRRTRVPDGRQAVTFSCQTT
jgi:hypothetical protein